MEIYKYFETVEETQVNYKQQLRLFRKMKIHLPNYKNF